MYTIFNKIIFFLICYLLINNVFGQELDSAVVRIDSLVRQGQDTVPSGLRVKISKDAISAVVKYNAADSNFTDITNKEIHLYGKAMIEYEGTSIKADYIVFNFRNNTAKAFYKRSPDYVGATVPEFTDKETKAKFHELYYNIKQKKGWAKNLSTQESEFFINGDKSKFVAKDSTQTDDHVYQQGAIISTCDHNPPHFGVRATRMKMIPKKIAVMGPAQLEIAQIPTPVVLPFGLFPLVKGRSSGLIFPRNYTFNPELGLGFEGIGYYFPINDYVDAKVTGNIWTRGTYTLATGVNYARRYKYVGSIDLNFSNNASEDINGERFSAKSFGIRVTHRQDAKAHPYRKLDGSINIDGNRNTQRINYDYNSTINNKLRSNLNFSYLWPQSPFSFRASFDHDQDVKTRVMNITLPNASLNMRTIQPFARKNQTGDIRWYENISVDYNAGLKNYVRTNDSTLFTKATLDKIQTGLHHESNINTNVRVLKYFNVVPSVRMDETYFVKVLEKNFNPDTVFQKPVEGELIRRVKSYGSIQDTLLRDFNILRKFNASVSVNTQVYGTFLKNRVRHTIKPSLSFNYAPETQQKYQKFVDVDSRPTENKRQAYNPFATGPFSQSLNEEQNTIAYSFNNILEAKRWSKRDSSMKKFNIFNNIYLSGNYNFAKDTQQWSDVSFSGNTDLIKGYSSLQFSGLLTPYNVNWSKSTRLNTLAIKNKSSDRVLLNLLTFNAGINTNLSFTQIKKLFEKKKKSDEAQPKKKITKNDQIEFVSVFDRITLNHNITFQLNKLKDGRDTFFIGTNSIYISGSYPLSKNWDLSVGSIAYDFKAGKLVYPSIGLSRDLHCWTMRFSWYPDSGVYSFYIGVKSGAFNFLKYDYNQNYIPRF